MTTVVLGMVGRPRAVQHLSRGEPVVGTSIDDAVAAAVDDRRSPFPGVTVLRLGAPAV